MPDEIAKEQARRYAEQPGRKWRILSSTDEGDVEVADQGVLDEVVIDHWLHLEQMDSHSWWARIGDARLSAHVNADGTVRVDVERGVYGETRGDTRTE